MDTLGSRVDRNAPAPAHEQVRERIRELILQGEFVAGEKLPSEPDIAERLGVSRMTANKAILALVAEGHLVREKGKGTFVAEPSPELLRCAVAIVPEDVTLAMEDYYFGALYWNVQATLADRGVPVEIVRLTTGIGQPGPKDAGLIAINPPERTLDELLAYARGGAPVVILGASWLDHGLNIVDSDNFLGAGLAVNHLADLGHRRIAILGACLEDSNSQDRLKGYRTAMKARQLTPRPEDEFGVEQAIALEDTVLNAILAGIRDGITAFFVAGPHLTVQLQAAVQRAGFRVPEDVSIVGYDDPAFLSMAHPAPTTIRQPLAEMAKAACSVLVERLQSGDPRSAKRVLDPELVVRSSTAAPRPT